MKTSLLPIDVGFDLKKPYGKEVKRFCVNVPKGDVEITYEDKEGKKATFKGKAKKAVKVLEKAGFCARVAKKA